MGALPPASPRSLTLPPPPGAPNSASSPAWAGPRPEGLHQRSCSVSSADQWNEAAALPPGMQDPVKPQRRAAGEAEMGRGARRSPPGLVAEPVPRLGHGVGVAAPVLSPGPRQRLALETLPLQLPARPPLSPGGAGGGVTSPSAPCAASSSASPRGGAGRGAAEWGGRRLGA